RARYLLNVSFPTIPAHVFVCGVVQMRRHQSTTLFPYTTLFRSKLEVLLHGQRGECAAPFRHMRDAQPGDVLRLHRDERTAAKFEDRKRTRLNSSHVKISYAVFCLNKKTKTCN